MRPPRSSFPRSFSRDHKHIAEEMAITPDEVATLLVLDHPLARVYRAITATRTAIFIIDKSGLDGPLGACFDRGCDSNPHDDPLFALERWAGFVALRRGDLATWDRIRDHSNYNDEFGGTKAPE